MSARKNEVLAHETCRGRNAGERKHEDKEKEGGGGAAMIESVKIVEFIADQAALAEARQQQRKRRWS